MPKQNISPSTRFFPHKERNEIFDGKCLKNLDFCTRFCSHKNRPKTWQKKEFVSLGCVTYFIEENTIQYSNTVVIIYYNTLQPMFPLNPFDCLRKNLNASRPSEYPPVRGGDDKTFRWDRRLQRHFMIVVDTAVW